VTKKGQLEYLGRLPASNDSVIWREIKKVGDTLIVGSEGVGHGIQFFDMKKLLKLSPKNPKTFDVKKDIGWMNITDGIPGRSHNVVANEELGYAVAVGCGGRAGRNATCAGGPIFINLDDPYNPYQTGCAPQDGYTHGETKDLNQHIFRDTVLIPLLLQMLSALCTADPTRSTLAVTSAMVRSLLDMISETLC
jgi:hypothetical protein